MMCTVYGTDIPADHTPVVLTRDSGTTCCETHCYACGDVHDGDCAPTNDVDAVDAGEYRGPGCTPGCGC